MKQQLPLACLVAFVVLAPASAIAAAPGDFDSVKALYAEASYEEALARLDTLDGEDPVLVNQYRALCLLGLGRARDAEAPLQRIVTANPLYRIAPGEVSPRLVDLFKDVRRRALPSAARQLYNKAKASYDAKNHGDAVASFKILLELFNDPELQRSPDSADLQDLAEGFLTLAESNLAPPTPPAPASPAPVEAAVAAAVPSKPRVFSVNDPEVKEPIQLERLMPRWMPTTAADQRRTFRGVLQLIVDERGAVEFASIVVPIYPGFNDELVRAAQKWRYRPATLQGAPVKYALAVSIVLRPSGPQDE